MPWLYLVTNGTRYRKGRTMDLGRKIQSLETSFGPLNAIWATKAEPTSEEVHGPQESEEEGSLAEFGGPNEGKPDQPRRSALERFNSLTSVEKMEALQRLISPFGANRPRELELINGAAPSEKEAEYVLRRAGIIR